jgi:hypothetical protein
MLFAIFIFLLLLAVVFFHYLQGFFSATLSAFFAVIAAVVAVSYHEWVVEQFLGNAMGDWGPPLVTLGMFAVTYLIFRLIFDKAIPGQIRLPSTMDKIGGAVMGLVAGTFALGTVVIAAQQMPLGASIAGYVRYETNSTRGIVVPTGFNTRAKDANAYDEVVGDNFDTAAPKGIVMVDDVVVAAVAHLSDGGSLATGKPFESVHPDYLQELFGQRLATETGSSLSAPNLPAKNLSSVDVAGVYVAPAFAPTQIVDHEFPDIRVGQQPVKQPPMTGDEMRVVVRVSFSPSAADKKDNRIRLAPAAVRLVAQRPDGAGGMEFHNYFPIGSIDPNGYLYLNKIDDPLYVNLSALKTDGGTTTPQVDFVFQVKKSGFLKAEEKGKPSEIADGTFIEVKRFGRVELSGDPKGVVKPTMAPPTVIALWRKHLEWKNRDGKNFPTARNPGGGGGGGMSAMMGSGMPPGVTPGPPGGTPAAQPAPPAQPAAMTPDAARQRMTGTWENTDGGDTFTYTFNADGSYTGAQKSSGKSGKGTWKVREVAADGSVVIDMVSASGNPTEQRWQFGSDNNQMTRKRSAGDQVFTRKG